MLSRQPGFCQRPGGEDHVSHCLHVLLPLPAHLLLAPCRPPCGRPLRRLLAAHRAPLRRAPLRRRSATPARLFMPPLPARRYELLSAKPEGEAKLLSGLVNKLGDPDRKLASKVSH